jgi:hypothetical protein
MFVTILEMGLSASRDACINTVQVAKKFRRASQHQLQPDEGSQPPFRKELF